MANRFIESAQKERYALGCILPSLNWNPNYKWQHTYTPEKGCEPYDCLTEGFSGDQLPKRFFIEIKIRTGDFPTLVLERKKLLGMRKAAEDFIGAKLLYINVCPSGTYIFDITFIDGILPIEHLKCNKTTATYNKDKVDKEVYMLPIESATRKIDFILDENLFKQYINNK